jgi:4-amino-4-deoxy-L-arabinose transferase-like glycosyltransferase
LWAGALGLALLFALLRWNNFNAPLTRDEGEYTYAARLLLDGRLPYENSFLQKPPMVVYSYALASLLSSGVFWAPRILAAVFAALATLLLGFIARREFGPGAALPAMWLMTPMILLPGINQFIANTEMFMLLPLVATVAVYVHSRHSRSGTRHWLAAGTLASITVCYKYTAFPLVAFVLVAWCAEEWHGGKSPRSLAAHWLAALAGGTLAALIILAPFLLRDGGRHLWECTIVFNRYYAVSFGLSGLWLKLVEFWRSWWILFLTPVFLVFKPGRRLLFWVILFLIAWLTSTGSGYGHYYIAIMPFWALLTTVALRGFGAWAAAKFSLPQKGLEIALTGVVLVVVCLPDLVWVMRTPEQFARVRMGSGGVFLESPFIAARLAQLTAGSDPVYVAGSEPQILCYAHRFSSTRFDIAYPLMIPTPLAQGYQAEAIADLQQNPPAAIVLVRAPSTWLTKSNSPPDFFNFLQRELNQNYQIVGGYRADGEAGRWQEPMGKEDLVHCSLVLFKRKAS